MANRNVCFSDFSKQKTSKERWHSLVSRIGDREEYVKTPFPLPPSMYGRSLARSLGRSYADVITKFSRPDGLPIFLTHGASLARFARWSSAINVSFFKKSYNFELTTSVTMSAINCSAGLAVVVVNLDVAVAEIVLRSWEDLPTTCDERCAVCTGL